MERNANYALVGVISTALLMALIVFVVLLAGNKFSRDYDLYDIVFQGPVRGLSQGAEVHFNGIKVGEVSKVSLDPHNPQLVIARARVTSDIPIRKDSYATLEPQGITGVNYIQITAGTATKPLLKDTVPEGVVPRMASQKDALSDLLAGGGFVLQRTVEALDRVNQLLSDQNIKTIGAMVSDLQATTAELRERKSIIADAQKTLQSADQAMQQIRDLAKSSNTLVNGPAKDTLTKLSATATEAQAALKDVRGLTQKLAGPTTEFATTGLPELTQAIGGLQRTTENLDRVLNEVQSNPAGLIGKAKAKEVEIKP
jgi:phospholipid/cholesterol/gamma-HCH transport system substrate-binding protein